MTNEELVVLYQRGDKKALDKLLKNNDGLIYKVASKFYSDYICFLLDLSKDS